MATILDEFSHAAWGPEWELDALTPQDWARKLAEQAYDLLLVESAWNGNGGAWQYHLTGPTAPRPALVEMVRGFRAAGIPTVFWNKEDPPHYADFLDTAKLFDAVLTSDVRKIPDYRRDLGHERIGVLPFAAQPEVHNPVRARAAKPTGVAFAGMYFAHKYPERREQLQLLLDGAVQASGRGGGTLSIFSRQHGGNAGYQFPEPFARHVVGALPYKDMVPAYQEFSTFLNVNSVPDSPSMCARRIFEISACGTPVLSATGEALRNYFAPDEVFEAASSQEASDILRMLERSPEQRDRSVHLAQRRIWHEHSYAHRARTVQQLAGVGEGSGAEASRYSMAAKRQVSVLAATNRPGQLQHLLDTVAAQRAVSIQLVLVTHGFDPDPRLLEDFRARHGADELIEVTADAKLSLGSCLNLGIERADGDFVAKLDDDDLYGEHYLADQVNALRYSGAELVGKQAHYMYLSASNRTLLRMAEREHRFTDLVMGPTMCGERELFDRLRFKDLTRGEDTDFQRRASQSGASIYSADRFNFMQMRQTVQTHTWQAGDNELAATGVVQFFGRNDDHVFF
ncbi:glycosyltransferase family protein [Glutamicibacter protophormiae]|uniref:glycosyltransferase family protein n=1 Tax=Glutamicibacter protophormiae TaxID=37930 RepID=UPI0030844DA0